MFNRTIHFVRKGAAHNGVRTALVMAGGVGLAFIARDVAKADDKPMFVINGESVLCPQANI
eukprot:1380501-Amorphochlora_amoeboformis.AAC.2